MKKRLRPISSNVDRYSVAISWKIVNFKFCLNFKNYELKKCTPCDNSNIVIWEPIVSHWSMYTKQTKNVYMPDVFSLYNMLFFDSSNINIFKRTYGWPQGVHFPNIFCANETKFENVSRNDHRIKTTQSNSMILSS